MLLLGQKTDHNMLILGPVLESPYLPFGPLDRSIVRMALSASTDPSPGQCFKQQSIVWEIVKISSFNNIPHVQIMQVGDPTERKLISVSSLRYDYDLMPAPGPIKLRAATP